MVWPACHGQRMNEDQMKTCGNTGEVSLSSVHAAGWRVEAAAAQGDGSAKEIFGTEKLLEKPVRWEDNRESDWRDSI